MNDIEIEYFNWLYDIICGRDSTKKQLFGNLVSALYNKVFTYDIPNDENRASEGLELRSQFAIDMYQDTKMACYIDGPCNILEMMTALAIHCENNITDDPTYGNRTSQWFWNMVNSLGLSGMTNSNFDPDLIDDVLERFLSHDYSPTGEGGLFTIKNCRMDMRNAEIWHQMCWYIDHMYGY